MEGRSESKKGFWTVDEDRLLMDYVKVHGKGKWNRVAKETGLKRSGKSCRLRWMNYLNPSVKRGNFSEEEDDLIIRLHNLLGNRWSLIAGRVPGRTDNQVKNHWNIHLSKRLGVKCEKDKINATSSTNAASSSFSIELVSNFNIQSTDSNFVLPYSYNNENVMDKIVIESGSQNADELETNLQESRLLSDCLKTSFWFSYNDPNLCGLNSMELLDESLDFIFRGL